ncbi:histidinol-phosphate transaminase [Occultella glacieicola]|uniref:Histidinol-phosphate aminotransferase n=1 Tax=Occultella glacieicola TaxID=2518684 RepID=A0ABY2E1I5_9MICO|nr:histidinol-phosphate transaminase [Occultella glacieicola]TDE90850.1 histidinol-phosphate transaminase [Occultella glacieicola]
MTGDPTTQPAPAVVLPLRADLVGEVPYGAPQLDVPHLLNVNENPYAPPADVVADIARSVAAAASDLNRYPDRDFPGLRQDLADYLAAESGADDLEVANLWAANGSNEVMLHLLQAFGGPGRSVMSFAPTYSMYPEYARDTLTRWVAGTRRSDFGLDPDETIAQIENERPAVVLLASPNNPTGTAVDVATIDAIASATTGTGPDGAATVLVVDEAYAEFRRVGTPSALSILARHPHLAVSRTMSKAFAFAGARLGYLAAAPALVDALQVVRLPYHLSAVTQAVARAALRHRDVLQAQVAQLRDERDATVAWLRELGFTVADSDANFAFFGRFTDRHTIWQGLLDRGVLIRETGPSEYLRVSIGTGEDMAAFRGALKEVTGR